MPLVRYQSPDDPAFAAFDRSRFRVEHGTFYLRPDRIRFRIGEVLDRHRDWDLAVMKLVEEDRRLRACSDWLDSLPPGGEDPVVPDLKHEPAIDRVADRMIGDGEFARVDCPACPASYAPGEVTREPWEFEEDGTTLRGRRTLCGRGHPIHAIRDEVEAPGIELDDD